MTSESDERQALRPAPRRVDYGVVKFCLGHNVATERERKRRNPIQAATIYWREAVPPSLGGRFLI